MAEEENEHANKFMEYQNKRGGTIVLLDVKVCALFYLLLECSSFSKFRHQYNKVGVRLSKLTKQPYNWKKMFIKPCLNCMHLLPSISMIFDQF
jgi:ferritin